MQKGSQATWKHSSARTRGGASHLASVAFDDIARAEAELARRHAIVQVRSLAVDVGARRRNLPRCNPPMSKRTATWLSPRDLQSTCFARPPDDQRIACPSQLQAQRVEERLSNKHNFTDRRRRPQNSRARGRKRLASTMRLQDQRRRNASKRSALARIRSCSKRSKPDEGTRLVG